MRKAVAEMQKQAGSSQGSVALSWRGRRSGDDGGDERVGIGGGENNQVGR